MGARERNEQRDAVTLGIGRDALFDRRPRFGRRRGGLDRRRPLGHKRLTARQKSGGDDRQRLQERTARSEEHTSELQSLMRISYAVFCLKKTKILHITDHTEQSKTT